MLFLIFLISINKEKKTKNEKIDTKKNKEKNSVNLIPSPRFEEYKNIIKKYPNISGLIINIIRENFIE